MWQTDLLTGLGYGLCKGCRNVYLGVSYDREWHGSDGILLSRYLSGFQQPSYEGWGTFVLVLYGFVGGHSHVRKGFEARGLSAP